MPPSGWDLKAQTCGHSMRDVKMFLAQHSQKKARVGSDIHRRLSQALRILELSVGAQRERQT